MTIKGRFLRKDLEIREIFKKGDRIRFGGFDFIYLRNGSQINRLLIRISRGYSGAVLRNRTKRWIRELFRSFGKEFFSGIDLIVLSRSSIDPSFAYHEMEDLFIRFVKLLKSPK